MQGADFENNYPKYHLGNYDLTIRNDFVECRIFWARIVNSENENPFTRYTKHTFYEIQYALRGRIGITVNQQHVDLSQSNFIVIPPDTYHQIIDGDSENARFIMAFSLQAKNERVLKDVIRALNTPKPHKETERMRPLLSLIFQKKYHDRPIRKQLIASLMETFLLEVMESISRTEQKETPPSNELDENKLRVQKINAMIRDHNGIGIRVSDIAERLNMSERHVNRIYSAETGYSLRDAIALEKQKKIEEYIATTSLSLNEISELCGFSDEYAMNKFFRKHTLTNLSDFRKLTKQ